MKWYELTVILFVFAAGFFTGRRERNVVIQQQVDTIVRVDTIREVNMRVQKVYVDRVDTVLMSIPGDTVRVPVWIPIERKEYKTENYKAVIEGYRPCLVSMELYQKTMTIESFETRAVTAKPRFGIGLQAGYGFNGKKVFPYIGVGMQINLLTWGKR